MLGTAIPLHAEMTFQAGIEYSYNSLFMLRGGYDLTADHEGSGGFSFGAGIAVSNHSLDYAYNLDDAMGGTHQLSFVFKFGEDRQDDEYSISTPVHQEEIAVQESYTDNKIENAPDHKIRYQICAAKYQNRASAEKHVATLKKLDIASDLYYDGYKEYRVVVGEADDLAKAEKMKSEFEKNGVFCYIQEL
jgi:hypothetical protein